MKLYGAGLSMRVTGRFVLFQLAFLLCCAFALITSAAHAQNRGPFKAHPGMEITTAFASAYGPDAESRTVVTGVDGRGVALSYTSSRGVVFRRLVPVGDALQAQTFVMGYANNMPRVIPGSTAMGLSTAALEQLRATGSIPYSLIYDARLSRIDGQLNPDGADCAADRGCLAALCHGADAKHHSQNGPVWHSLRFRQGNDPA